ncbi:MAG: RNA polymerase sigma factor [Thioalkalispiraceae bacterium]|jgi:RNA polymerase sigma-70 factor (ECF subfamily)
MAMISLFAGRRARQFEKQLRPHLTVLYRYAYRLTGSRDDAEDIVQDLLIRLYEKQIKIEDFDNPTTWLLKVLYRQFIDWRRKTQRTPTLLKDDNAEEILDALPHEHLTPEQELQQQQTQQDLSLALDQLNDDQRILIMLHDVEGFTLQELHEVLDTPIGTLKSRLHRGRQQLRTIYANDREPVDATERVNG